MLAGIYARSEDSWYPQWVVMPVALPFTGDYFAFSAEFVRA